MEEQQLKSIVITDSKGVQQFWNPILDKWQRDVVRILPDYAEKYFEEVITKDPKSLIDLIDAP